MTTYDDSFGALLIAGWLESMLFTVVIYETIFYYRKFPRDSRALKILVAVSFILDTVGLIAHYAGIYLYVVTYWGNVEAVAKYYWPLTVYTTTTGLIATLANGFLVNRFYRLSRNKFLALLLVALILLLLVTAFVVLAIFGASDYGVAEIPKIVVIRTVWFVSTSIIDITISFLLVWQLSRMQTSDNHTRSFIYRLIRTVLQTGMVTTLLATVMAVVCLIPKTSTTGIPDALFYLEGQLYMLTLLYNLNTRQKMRYKQPASPVTTRTTSNHRRSNSLTKEATRPQIVLTDVQFELSSLITDFSQMSSELDFPASKSQN